ncbi:MAG: hypothetical protein ACE5QW_03830 [Thermoplasmata archaeon]
MKAEIAVLLAAAAVLLVIGLFGHIITEVKTVASEPPDNSTIEKTIRPYLPAGVTSLALGLVILLVAGIVALAMRTSRR